VAGARPRPRSPPAASVVAVERQQADHDPLLVEFRIL